MEGWWWWRREVVIFTAMVATEVSKVGMNTLFKAASSKGLSCYIFLVYSYALGSLLLLPFSLFSPRSSSQVPPLSFSVVSKTGLLGLLGCMYTIMGYTGVEYSSPTLASALSNLTPSFTFILAILFRMEKISLRKESSVAKVVGTLLCIVGALVATLYHGPPVLFVASQPSDEHLRRPPLSPQRRPSANSDWIIGGGLLVLENILVPISYIVQTQIMREYPLQFRVTNFYAVCVSVLCALVTLIAEKNNPNAWIITSQLSLICIVAAGVQNLGYYVIHLWVVRYKGPVFIAMFRPLSIIIAIVLGAIFLGNSLYLGSLIGGMVISIGFYTVMWGKAKEEEEKVIESPPSEEAPFLINYKK